MHFSIVRRPVLALVAFVLVGACGSNPESGVGVPAAAAKCKADPDCAATAGKPRCDVPTGACVALPPGHEIGLGDGTASSVTFTEIYAVGSASEPVDLAFHKERADELWVIGYGDDSIRVGTGVGTDAMKWKRIDDPAAMHFMHKPPAITMGTPAFWATCGDSDNTDGAGHAGDGSAKYFMGPALFSTDLTILGKETGTGLGSHMDMLHGSPFCRGIAHVSENWFWVFNSHDKSLDKYNFAKDHGPGKDDHSDGEIYRYAPGQVKGAEDSTPSHIFYDDTDKFLYVADTGNQRIVKLDTAKGTKGGALPRQMEPLKAQGIMKNTNVEVVVAAGTLKKPSGLEVRGEHLYVTDAETSTFHVFDKAGAEVRKLATGFAPGSLAGFAFSGDGKIYFTDKVRSRVFRIDTN